MLLVLIKNTNLKLCFVILVIAICHRRFLVDLEKLIKYKEEAQRWKQKIKWSRTEQGFDFRSREEDGHPLPMPEKLRDGRDGIAFGNIMKIAEFHRDIFTEVISRRISFIISL